MKFPISYTNWQIHKFLVHDIIVDTFATGQIAVNLSMYFCMKCI